MKRLRFDVRCNLSPQPAGYDVVRLLKFGDSETVAQCWDVKTAKKIAHLLSEDIRRGRQPKMPPS